MTDLRIDYQGLAYTHVTLSQLAAWFDSGEPGVAADDAVLGSPAVAAAMAAVGGNWTFHRKQLVRKMRDLHSLAGAALAEFESADVNLGKKI